jgi:putative ABC transport system substrate-binding protein
VRRREFIGLMGAVAATRPLAARAQKPTMPVIGFVNSASAQGYAHQLAAFLKGLGEVGYVDGRNATIEYRWAEGKLDRLPALVADLVRRPVAVIAATTSPAAQAAKAATTTIPIVFETGVDPIQTGLITSLSRPGGNVTGVTQMNVEVAPKRLQMLHELLPAVRVMALLVNPADPDVSEVTVREMQAAARAFGVELHVLNARNEHDFDAAFADLSQIRAGGLVIGGGAFMASHREQLAALTVRHAVPAIFQHREFTAAGGLMSYGSDIADAYRLAGVYTGRVLKGHKPADLPVQQATKVELYINLKAAKALGINVPLPLLGRADAVIE